jgi:hypothetical protein
MRLLECSKHVVAPHDDASGSALGRPAVALLFQRQDRHARGRLGKSDRRESEQD